MFGRVVDAEGLAVAEALAQRSTRQQGGMSLVRRREKGRGAVAVPAVHLCAAREEEADERRVRVRTGTTMDTTMVAHLGAARIQLFAVENAQLRAVRSARADQRCETLVLPP